MIPPHEQLTTWRQNPVSMVINEFGAIPDPFQSRALEAFARADVPRMRISMQACVGPGKSTVEAWIGLNFLACYGEKGEHPKGACVSITGENLRDNLWSEFAKWMNRSAFFRAAFTWQKERIFAKDHPETWFLSARQFSRKANANEQGRTLSGLHAKYVLILLDESGDIPVSVLQAAEQALSSCAFGRIVQAGNPTSLTGALHAAVEDAGKWVIIPVTGDPDDPARSTRVDIVWAAEEIRKAGRDDPWVMATILGQFPPGGLNGLISPVDVEPCMGRHLREDQYAGTQRRLGVDVARFGDDRTVIFARQGLWSLPPVVMRGARTNEIASRVALAKARWHSEVEAIDDTGGWGAGVVDGLILQGISPLPVNFAGKADDPKYFNKRAEMWFRMRDWILRGGALPDVPGLQDELCAPTYGFRGGRILLEEKDAVKRRLKSSPDMADALALTFAVADQATDPFAALGVENPRHRTVTELDESDGPGTLVD